MCVCVCVCVCVCARSVTESCWTLGDPIAHLAPLSKGLSRQEYWSELPCPPLGDLPAPGIRSNSCLLNLLQWQVESLSLAPTGKPSSYPNNDHLVGFPPSLSSYSFPPSLWDKLLKIYFILKFTICKARLWREIPIDIFC